MTKNSSESKAFHSALVNAVEAFEYIHKKTKKPHYQLHPDQTWIGMHYAHHRSLLERVRAHVRRARACACACGDSCCTARALNSSRMVCLESSSVVVEQGYWLVPGHCRCILYLSKWRLYSRDCEGLWSFSTYRVFMPCKNR